MHATPKVHEKNSQRKKNHSDFTLFHNMHSIMLCVCMDVDDNAWRLHSHKEAQLWELKGILET